MTSFWHPLSTILLSEPRCFATRNLLQMFLGSRGQVDVIYAGDRMWPAIAHGATIAVRAMDDAPRPGEVVLACPDDIPDLRRVVECSADRVVLTADADPDGSQVVARQSVIARTRLPLRSPHGTGARLRRLLIDLREACSGSPDARADAAETVLDKYDSQAAYYAGIETEGMDAGLLDRITRGIPRGEKILVVGSGTGRESFALAAAGWNVTGVEFSPAMNDLARKEAGRRGLQIDFRKADIRQLTLPEASLGGVLFTYDVYSFLPCRNERIAVLRRMRSWLRPGGLVYLSARRARSFYERFVIGVQWAALQRNRRAEWGDSHTRWIATDGTLRRSFVHVFSHRRLRREVTAGGFHLQSWQGGHGTLSPIPPAIIDS